MLFLFGVREQVKGLAVGIRARLARLPGSSVTFTRTQFARSFARSLELNNWFLTTEVSPGKRDETVVCQQGLKNRTNAVCRVCQRTDDPITCRLRVGVKDDVHGPVQDLHVVGHGVQRLHRLLGEDVGHPALRGLPTRASEKPSRLAPKSTTRADASAVEREQPFYPFFNTSGEAASNEPMNERD